MRRFFQMIAVQMLNMSAFLFTNSYKLIAVLKSVFSKAA